MRVFFIMFFAVVVSADPPSDPIFSLSNIELHSPVPLPEIYGVQLPFEDVAKLTTTSEQILPNIPVLMELCVITDQTTRMYQNGSDLMLGCRLGETGLSYFVIEPYQYWEALAVPTSFLMPKIAIPEYPSIVMSYVDSIGRVIGNIEVGISFNTNYIYINGNMFEQDAVLMGAIYKFVSDIYDSSYTR